MHEIFLKDDKIHKIPKDNFKEFHNLEHFKIEKITLGLLAKKKLPSVKIIDIQKNKKPVLIEEYIKEGYQKKKGTLSKKEINSLLLFLKKVHQIKLNKFGQIRSDSKGTHNSWDEFIINSSKNNLVFLLDNGIINNKFKLNIEAIINNSKKQFIFNKKGSLILTDINPMNFFFKNEKIYKIIDMDHPLIGDPLYEYASIKWYHKDIFEEFINKEKSKKNKLKKIKFYEIIHGLSVIRWSFNNKLNTKEDIRKLKKLVKKIEDENS